MTGRRFCCCHIPARVVQCLPWKNALPKLKRLAAVHDISGFGKCSLTVALPVVSATGVECACIPTALLSTHTGEFTRLDAPRPHGTRCCP